MNRNLSLFAFILGLFAVVWVAIGYIGGHTLAFSVSCLIAMVYVAGALEMRRFHDNTTALAKALGNIPDDIGYLGEWLQLVPAALQNAVRLRIEGERVALPGPGITPYLVGLLVLLGMLGTFLGMVVTLNGAVLALESTTDLQTIRSALAAPVKGLGVAFGTSVAGVATSAMLGLISALCRRDRLQVGQLLDSKIASVLRDFSLTYQRQETFKALQAQSQALPELVGKLDAMMSQMAEQNRLLGEQLAAGQQRFHEEAKGLYTDLAQSVDQSLKASLKDSATVAAETIQPVVTATMAGIANETRGLHDKLFGTVETQLAGIAGQFAQTVTTVSDTWPRTGHRHPAPAPANRPHRLRRNLRATFRRAARLGRKHPGQIAGRRRTTARRIGRNHRRQPAATRHHAGQPVRQRHRPPRSSSQPGCRHLRRTHSGAADVHRRQPRRLRPDCAGTTGRANTASRQPA
ncbi:MAG: hypothetical protein FD131_2702 [Rhodocyclaceae bacterium]|nr:MAG: hypothetical protein FD131_2702 [Rhodocyclaceae bacterium]